MRLTRPQITPDFSTKIGRLCQYSCDITAFFQQMFAGMFQWNFACVLMHLTTKFVKRFCNMLKKQAKELNEFELDGSYVTHTDRNGMLVHTRGNRL